MYDIVLKKSNGDHLYILLNDKKNESIISGLSKANIETGDTEDGRVRLDEFGEAAGPLNDAEVHLDGNGNEIIVTNNIQQFLDHGNYDAFEFNNEQSLDRK